MTTTGTYYPPALGTGQFLCNPPFQMNDTDTTISNRDDQHGGIQRVGHVAQQLKNAMRYSGLHWGRLDAGQREALDMIQHKIAQILSGADPHDLQHWEDVAGYALEARERVGGRP